MFDFSYNLSGFFLSCRMLEEILNTRIMVKGAMKKAKEDKVIVVNIGV